MIRVAAGWSIFLFLGLASGNAVDAGTLSCGYACFATTPSPMASLVAQISPVTANAVCRLASPCYAFFAAN